MNLKFKYILIGVIIGMIIGGIAGVYFGIDLVINKFLKVIPTFTNITIDDTAIRDALFKYSNNINSCIN